MITQIVPKEYLIFKIQILKRVFLAAGVLSLTAFFIGQKGFSAGILVGGLVSISVFSLLYKYILDIRGFTAPRRKRVIISKYFIVYIIMAAALFIGIKKGLAVFLGVAAGLILLKIAIFTETFKTKHVSR